MGKIAYLPPGAVSAQSIPRRQPNMRYATPAAIAVTALLVSLASFAADFPYWP